jgi:hypothetical protein
VFGLLTLPQAEQHNGVAGHLALFALILGFVLLTSFVAKSCWHGGGKMDPEPRQFAC